MSQKVGSSLAEVVKLSPNFNRRKHPISKITIHHMAGNLSVESCGAHFLRVPASSNYGIGSDGRIGLYVPEDCRAWTSSNAENDHRAITIEVANNGTSPDWPVSDLAYNALLVLCVDICVRNRGIVGATGKRGLFFTGLPQGSLTHHRMFAATTCPGPFLLARFPALAEAVNVQLAACMIA